MTDEEKKFLRLNAGRVQASKKELETWQTGVISLFNLIVQRNGDDVEAAWEKVELAIKLLSPDVGPDDLAWSKEMATAQRAITQEEAQRVLARYKGRAPLIDGLTAVIQESNGK